MTALTGCGKLEDTDVVATVAGDDITADVANFYARYTQAQYETYYAGYMGEDMWSGEAAEGKSYEESVKEGILETLENLYVMEDHMKDFEVEVTEEDTAAVKKAAGAFDEANGLAEKEKVSGGKETVERVLTLMTVQQKMQNAIAATADMEVSDEEAAQKKMQYVQFPFTKTDEEENTVDLTDDEKAALKSEAEEFVKGAKEAADFGAYVKEKGKEATDAAFDAKSTNVPTEVVKAADALGENEVTDLVETANGYYVAKVVSLFDKEATDSKKETIVAERKQAKVEETLKGWRKDADIEVDKKVWKKIDFNKLSVTIKQNETEPYADEVQTDDVAK